MNAFVPVSQFIKILKKVIKVCLPYMNHFDFLLGYVERTGDRDGLPTELVRMEANFLPFFWC